MSMCMLLGSVISTCYIAEHDMSAAQVLRGVQQVALWMIGEYVYLWMDECSLLNAYCFEYVAYHKEKTAITEIMQILISTIWTEQSCIQLTALEALYKVAIHAVNMSGDYSQKTGQNNVFGIVSYIRHEFHAVLPAAIGFDQAYMNNGVIVKYLCCMFFSYVMIFNWFIGWVYALSESQRLVALGLPSDTGIY